MTFSKSHQATESTALLGLGSNLGDRLALLQSARRLLEEHPKIRILALSHVYETEPLTLNGEAQHWYLNAVAKIATTLNPVRLLRVLQAIEDQLGRVRQNKWEPRSIDLDLLGFGDEILKSQDLTLPHPELHQRRFVLEPLNEIAPNWKHPVTGKTVRSLLKALRDNKQVHALYKFQISHPPQDLFPGPVKKEG